MGSSNRYVNCRESKKDCNKRTLEGKCRILTNTEFKKKDGKVKECPFYKPQNTPA